MIVLFLAFCCLLFKGSKLFINGFNKDFISKQQSTIINGFFALIVLFSHFSHYVNPESVFDVALVKLMNNISQLMVTTFLFFSGYGIFESIKNKKDYLKNFLSHRLLPVWFNLSISVTLYLIMNLLFKIKYSTFSIIFAFTGYTNVGTSNWYIFITIILYLLTMFSFSNAISKGNYKRAILIFVLFSALFIGIFGLFMPNYFVNTLMCFSFGMIFSLLKDSTLPFIIKRYYIVFFALICIFVFMFVLKKQVKINNNIYYNLLSIIFVSCIIMFMLKVSFNNAFFEFLGRYVFWIYTLQRIPMIIFQNIVHNNYLYFLICFSITLLLSFFADKLSKFALKKGN